MTKIRFGMCIALFALAVAGEAHAVDWIHRARVLSQDSGRPAAEAVRAVALVQNAISDARSASRSNGGNGGSAQVESATVAMAAYAVLERLFPERQLDLEIDLAVALADVPESQAKADALVTGRRVAAALLER